jgi:hypothetical protein
MSEELLIRRFQLTEERDKHKKQAAAYLVLGIVFLVTGGSGSNHPAVRSVHSVWFLSFSKNAFFNRRYSSSVQTSRHLGSADRNQPCSLSTAISSSPSASPVSENPNERYSCRAASFSGSYDSQQYSALPQGKVFMKSRAS